MSIGERIKRLREQKNWSQLLLAEKIYINNSVLSRIEAGKRNIEDELLCKLADVFEVSCDYLLVRTDDPIPTQRDQTFAEEKLTEEEKEFLERSLEMFRVIKAKYM